MITSLNQFKLVDIFLLNRDKFSEAFCLIWFKCIEFLAKQHHPEMRLEPPGPKTHHYTTR